MRRRRLRKALAGAAVPVVVEAQVVAEAQAAAAVQVAAAVQAAVVVQAAAVVQAVASEAERAVWQQSSAQGR